MAEADFHFKLGVLAGNAGAREFIDADPIDQPQFVVEGVRLLRPGGAIIVHRAALGGRGGTGCRRGGRGLGGRRCGGLASLTTAALRACACDCHSHCSRDSFAAAGCGGEC